jgi:hypothetical protein
MHVRLIGDEMCVMGWSVGLRRKREDDAYICGWLGASSFPHFLVDLYALSIHTCIYNMGFNAKI